MNKEIKKMFALPLDVSLRSLKSIDYLDLIFQADKNINVALLHAMPRLPSFLVETCMSSSDSAKELKAIKNENKRIANEILKKGKTRIEACGYISENIQEIRIEEQHSIPQDICRWSEGNQVDAILLHTRGLSKLEAFFMGQVTMKLLECCQTCPIWVIKGNVQEKNILLPIDASEKALKAVDHAGFILKNTDNKIILFHSKQELSSFVPRSLLGNIPSIKAIWAQKSKADIKPYIEKAQEILLNAGIPEKNITLKVIEGTEKADKDILKEAAGSKCGTIVIGRQGFSSDQVFVMGGNTRKILEGASDMAVWIV
ncbi:Universal stress protein A family protein [Desulfonema limicola]|uniref:Universal stress protein A family protein n=1 Tax=Desulfonema limicola TaxID=45656 RepID=A0A975GIT6_9BACT|nr:universal stress protein [Desulfonema limicola]QTA82920.1 Universal stress protein A family protein [Desulfonema limicola]